jgi:hypothetical protein
MHKKLMLALTAAALATPAVAQPIPVPSDARTRYTALEIKPKPRGRVEVLTRREGSSGITFALREIDCDTRTFRYLGEGDTREKAARGEQRNAANNKSLGPLTEGSISTHVANFACAVRR